jgi:predicted DNA-binding antitoxin AbrB/MazE fold protein
MPRQGERIMSITVEAIYEAGTLKLLGPLPELPEHTRIRLTIEPQTADTNGGDKRFPTELLARIDRRRAAIFQRQGELTDSADLIHEGREQELE